LEQDPRIKFHPTRVEEFIDEHGLDQLERGRFLWLQSSWFFWFSSSVSLWPYHGQPLPFSEKALRMLLVGGLSLQGPVKGMSAPTPSPAVPITRVENFGKWFALPYGWGARIADGWIVLHLELHALLPTKENWFGYPMATDFPSTTSRPQGVYIAVIKELIGMAIGEAGCVWAKEQISVEYEEAKVKFSDLFQFYTTADAVLRLPECSMRAAVVKYLEEANCIK
jgi:hypothetical protein